MEDTAAHIITTGMAMDMDIHMGTIITTMTMEMADAQDTDMMKKDIITITPMNILMSKDITKRTNFLLRPLTQPNSPTLVKSRTDLH